MNTNGYKDTDAVLTTRELARMIRELGLRFDLLDDQSYDELMGDVSGAGTIFGTTGGVTEAAIRTVKEKLTGEELERLELDFRGTNEATVEIGDKKINVAIANGLAKASEILKAINNGEKRL